MFAVAIPELTGDPETVARKLQEAGGKTMYEERQRIGHAFPRVVATCADRHAADLQRKALAAAGARAVVIFSNLGDAMQPSRAANFGWLVDQLRTRAAGAVYDERLMTRAGQKQVLGALDVESYTDLAVALVNYACWLEARPSE